MRLNKRASTRSGFGPAAAGPNADCEAGSPGDDTRRALFALDAMLKRGLIDRADYEARRKAIVAEEASRPPAASSAVTPPPGPGESEAP